jgi:hypothetical protein
MILAAGCFTHSAVERSAAPLVELQDYQPVAVLPPADASGFAGSGALLRTAIHEALKAKNFTVTEPARADEVVRERNLSAEEISRGAAIQVRLGEALRSRIILVATFLDYRSQRSYVSSDTSQVWHGGAYEYQSLPTYHQGVCEMKIRLKMLAVEQGTAVWTAEGRASGPGGSERELLRRLVTDLTRTLPFLPENSRNSPVR